MIGAARRAPDLDALPGAPRVRRFLGEALDAVSDGMPADYAAMILYAALGAIRDGEQRL